MLVVLATVASATDPKPLKAFCPECVAVSPVGCPRCPAAATASATITTAPAAAPLAVHHRPLRTFVANVVSRPLFFRCR